MAGEFWDAPAVSGWGPRPGYPDAGAWRWPENSGPQRRHVYVGARLVVNCMGAAHVGG